MAYQITYSSRWTHTLTGKRLPSKESRATLESAEARALRWFKEMAHAEPGRYVHPDGSVYLGSAATLSAWIEADA
jgi:hypothetical protein